MARRAPKTLCRDKAVDSECCERVGMAGEALDLCRRPTVVNHETGERGAPQVMNRDPAHISRPNDANPHALPSLNILTGVDIYVTMFDI